MPDVRNMVGLVTVPGARDVISGRPSGELPPSTTAPGGRPVPRPHCPAEEVEALAGLLAEVVELGGNRAMFPGRLTVIAELAQGHDSVRRALRGEESGLVGPRGETVDIEHLLRAAVGGGDGR